MKTLLSLHGFNSSPASAKAQLTRQYLEQHHPGVRCEIPSLSFAPADAIDCAETILRRSGETVLIGSSLGGYYANYLAQRHGCRAVLVNPAVYPDRLLSAYYGPNTNPVTGEQYVLEPVHLQQLRELAVPVISVPQLRFVLVQTGDETLDFREASAYYQACKCHIEYGGDHSFQAYCDVLPRIMAFLDL